MPRFGYWLLVTRYSYYPTPRRALRDTPPAQVPPTQTLFARGPMCRGGKGVRSPIYHRKRSVTIQ